MTKLCSRPQGKVAEEDTKWATATKNLLRQIQEDNHKILKEGGVSVGLL